MGVPLNHQFSWDFPWNFPWNKPTSYWGSSMETTISVGEPNPRWSGQELIATRKEQIEQLKNVGPTWDDRIWPTEWLIHHWMVIGIYRDFIWMLYVFIYGFIGNLYGCSIDFIWILYGFIYIYMDLCMSHRKTPGNTKHVLDGHWFVEIDGNC